MASNEGFRKYIEAGAVLGQVTRARAEEIVRELVGAGEVQRGQAQDWIDDLVDRSRKASEELLQLVRGEVATQLAALGVNPEDLAKQVADILKHSAEVGRKATTQAAKTATARAGTAAARAKKTAPKRSAPKKAAPKEAAAKKAAVKKAATKKTAPKKAGAAKKAAPRKAAAKTTGPSAGSNDATPPGSGSSGSGN